ncbi:low molecular weight phosphatase family protein [Kordiimonas lacus]|uniref:Protein-tyrosine-phosphatase n=1 Tax=Kordiimonas lacus TaxID=637679 RepID=A0A1G6UGT8_9PROT|nr:arsenate reductase ArsC [Kordiimonas lacus]SDD40454.1 Protein-tyrosine-phosphatase [Kordiimonas lacus]
MTEAPKSVKSVLFVCNQNAVRSPMAEALASKHSKRRLFVESAGLIAGALDPFSVAALKEEGIDISNHKSLTLADVKLDAFDLIVALTKEAKDHIEKDASAAQVALEYWPTPDPSDAEGNRNQIMDSYRLVRDHLECRIADRFPY